MQQKRLKSYYKYVSHYKLLPIIWGNESKRKDRLSTKTNS